MSSVAAIILEQLAMVTSELDAVTGMIVTLMALEVANGNMTPDEVTHLCTAEIAEKVTAKTTHIVELRNRHAGIAEEAQA